MVTNEFFGINPGSGRTIRLVKDRSQKFKTIKIHTY